MSATLPQGTQNNFSTKTSTREQYTTSNFVDMLISELYSLKDQSITTFMYPAFADEISFNKSEIIQKLDVNIQAAVKKAQDNGYDFLTHFTPQSIKSLIGIDHTDQQQIDHFEDWLLNNFNSGIDAINTEIENLVNTGIADKTPPIILEAKKQIRVIAANYGLDIDNLVSGNLLHDSIIYLENSIKDQYYDYKGDLFNPSVSAFYNKNGFDLQKILDEYKISVGFKAAIAQTVKLSLTRELDEIKVKPDADDRIYLEAKYNYEIYGTPITSSDLDSNFLPGIEAVIEKYTKAGNIEIPVISISIETKGEQKLIVLSLSFDIDGINKTIKIINPVNTHKYSIVELNELSLPYTNEFKALINNASGWNDGDVITEQEIMDNDLSLPGQQNLSDLFAKFDKIRKQNPDVRVVITFKNNQLIFQFFDDSIKSGEFDFGDETNVPADKLGYVMNRNHTFAEEDVLSTIPEKPFFSPRLIRNIVIDIEYSLELDHYAKLLEHETNGKQGGIIQMDQFVKKDGTFKSVSNTDFEQIFPSFKNNFVDLLPTGYTYNVQVNSISDGYFGKVMLDVTLFDSEGYSRIVEVVIDTRNTVFTLQYIESEMEKYENGWEDETESLKPSDFGDGSDYEEGGVPTLTSLGSIFPGIEKLGESGVTLTVGANIEEKNLSSINTKLIMNWMAGLFGSAYDEEGIKREINSLIESIDSSWASPNSTYIFSKITVTYGGESIVMKLKTVHYMSNEQRFILSESIKKILDIFGNSNIGGFEVLKQKMMNKVNIILQPGDENALVPDWRIKELFANFNKDIIDLSIIDTNKIKSVSMIFKYILTGIGAVLGLSSMVGFLIPIKTALGNRKFNKKNAGPKRKSKKLIITSTISALVATTASSTLLIYTFIVQGGF